MARWTHRRYQDVLRWLDNQWDEPDRHDHYAMMIGAEVRRGYCKDPASVSINDMRLGFGGKHTTREPVNPDVQLDLSKAYWKQLLEGFPATFVPAPGQTEFHPRKRDWDTLGPGGGVANGQ